MDEIDIAILKSLLKDARTSFAKIARDCDVSTNTIVTRFQTMRQNGLIAGTSLILNMKRFGYQSPLSVDLIVEAGKENEVLGILKQMSDIRSCYEVVGKYDIHSIFHIKTLEEIDQIRDVIKRNKEVKKVVLTATLDFSNFFAENLSLLSTETK